MLSPYSPAEPVSSAQPRGCRWPSRSSGSGILQGRCWCGQGMACGVPSQSPGPFNPTTVLVALLFLWFLFALLCNLFNSRPPRGSTRRGDCIKTANMEAFLLSAVSLGRTERCFRSISPPQPRQSCQVSDWRGHCRGLRWTLRSTVLTRTWLCPMFSLCPEATGTGGSNSRLRRAGFSPPVCRHDS